MADLLIRGMEMPKSCSECRMLEGDTMDGLCHAANKWLDDEYFRWYQYAEEDFDMSKPLNCPLVELPPHGRLGDLDKLAKVIADHDYPLVDYFNSCGRGMFTVGIQQAIDEADTIIPASKEGGE